MIFCCNYCPATFPQVKQLFDHYEAEHKNQKQTLYRIKHLPSGEKGLASAPTPEQACSRLGWDIKDCKAKEASYAELLQLPQCP